ncbi:ADP-ribosyltransferase, partial [Nocardia gipuzkoensis]
LMESQSEWDRLTGACQQYLGLPGSVDSIARQIELLDQATRRPVPISEPLRLVRGLVDIGFLLDMDGNRLGARDPALLIGTVQTEPGFLSTSVSRDMVTMPDGRVFKYRLNLVLPVGGHGLWIGRRSGVPDATELLLPRSTRYRITSVYSAGNLVILDAEVLVPRGYSPSSKPRIGLTFPADSGAEVVDTRGESSFRQYREPAGLIDELTTDALLADASGMGFATNSPGTLIVIEDGGGMLQLV